MHIFSLTLFILKRMKDHSAFIYLHLWTLFSIYLVNGVYGIKIEGKYSFNSYILTKVLIYFLCILGVSWSFHNEREIRWQNRHHF